MTTMLDPDSRRLRILEIDKGLLVSILQGAARKLTFNGMPNDARIVGCQDDFFKDTIKLKIWSASFSPVVDGGMIPPFLVVVT